MSVVNEYQKIYQNLFHSVQCNKLFGDSKYFADAIPKSSPDDITAAYNKECSNEDFDLRNFVHDHFILPSNADVTYQANTKRPIREHIAQLWDALTRPADESKEYSSLIALPKPYIVPGGRFREIYYWDCYFAMLGCTDSGHIHLIESMLDNLAYLIDEIGFMPNGNRSYFCSRSQPPFFPLMVELLVKLKGDESLFLRYLTQMEKEYNFWMSGHETLKEVGDSTERVVKVDGGFLNRYWDNCNEPRPESYIEDIQLALSANHENAPYLYRNIRAACESGWDFSSRWCMNREDLGSINTSEIIPVDLNSLMYNYENTLSKSYKLCGDDKKAEAFEEKANFRKAYIQCHFYHRETGFFNDLSLKDFSARPHLSLAGLSPLFFKLASTEQGATVAKTVKDKFLKAGGWVTTLNVTEQQWDAPNGWAPLQWITYCGLQNYGFSGHAQEGALRWIANNIESYQETGKLLEKYNVEEPGKTAKGGEYSLQHGFGWTNGVLLKMMNELGL